MSDMLLTYTATNQFGESISSLYCYVEPQGLTHVDPHTGQTVGQIEADLVSRYGAYGEVKTTIHESAATYYKEKYDYMVAKEVTQERFDDMLEVLPPCRWNRNALYEAYIVGECLVMNLYSVFIHIKSDDKYYEVVAEKTVDYAELVKHIQAKDVQAGA